MSYLPQGGPGQHQPSEKGRIAAVIGTAAAIATILTFIFTQPWHHSHSPSPPTPSGSTLPSTIPSTGGSMQAIRWQGPITINQQGVELDAIPPSYAGSSTLFFLLGAGKTVEAGGGAFMADWTGSSIPTSSQCQNQMLTSNVGVVDFFEGQEICVETQEKHIAYIRVTSVSNNSVEAQATVWN
jgi:hypothetical protein